MEEIKKVIAEYYVQAVFSDRNTEAMRRGFDPGFVMSILKDGTLNKLPLNEWIGYIEASLLKNPQTSSVFTHEVELLDVTANVAMAKVKIFKDSLLLFTDYLSLYQFPDGWRIVNKVFQSH